MPATTHASPPILALTLLLLGSIGIAATWIMIAYAGDGQASWVALLAAVDAALLLRLGRMRPGWQRSGWAVAGTVLAIVLANWGVVAAQMGKPMGLLPWQSMFRLGADFVWTLVQLANGPVDIACWTLALVVAVITSR